MAGKRYQAKDRKVAKMERTGLVEENVRTGEKSRTTKESIREITFEGRSDSGRREDPAVQNTLGSSAQSSSRNTGRRRFHRDRDLRERETDGFGNQEPFKSYSNESFPAKEDTRESPYFAIRKKKTSGRKIIQILGITAQRMLNPVKLPTTATIVRTPIVKSEHGTGGKRQKNTRDRIPLQEKERMDPRMNPAQE